jgi:hypothetical protein
VPPSHAEIDRDGTVTATRPARELRRRRTLRGDGALSREDGGRPPCRCVARPSLGARRDGVRARRPRVTCGTRSRPARRAPAGQWARGRRRTADGGTVIDADAPRRRAARWGRRARSPAVDADRAGASGAVTEQFPRRAAVISCRMTDASRERFSVASRTNPGAFGPSGGCASCRCVYRGHCVRPGEVPAVRATQARCSSPLLIFVVVSVPGCSRVFLVARSSVRGE